MYIHIYDNGDQEVVVRLSYCIRLYDAVCYVMLCYMCKYML